MKPEKGKINISTLTKRFGFVKSTNLIKSIKKISSNPIIMRGRHIFINIIKNISYHFNIEFLITIIQQILDFEFKGQN